MANIDDILKGNQAKKFLKKKPVKKRPWTVMVKAEPSSEDSESPETADSLSPTRSTQESKAANSEDKGKQKVSKPESKEKQTVSVSEAIGKQNKVKGNQTVSKKESIGKQIDSPALKTKTPETSTNTKPYQEKPAPRKVEEKPLLEANSNQTVSVSEAIGKQDSLKGSQKGINSESIGKQSEIEKESKWEAPLSESPTRSLNWEAQKESIGKQTVSYSESIGNQTGSKTVDSDSKFETYRVSELDLKILSFIFEQCLKNGARKTPPLKRGDIAFASGTTEKTVKTQIQRMIKKSYLVRGPSKPGRGGWTIYILPDEVHEKIYQFRLENRDSVSNRQAIRNQMESEREVEREAQKEVTPSSSSSEANQKTPTTLTEEWKSVDFSKVESIGFSESHVRQIMQRKALTPEQLQDSIDHFVFDIEKNGKLKTVQTTPLNVFMSVIGRGRIYLAPGYVSEQDELLEKYLAEKMQRMERRKQLINDVLQMEFEIWRSEMSKDRLLEIISEDKFKSFGSPAYEADVKSYFEAEIWPEKRKSVPGLD